MKIKSKVYYMGISIMGVFWIVYSIIPMLYALQWQMYKSSFSYLPDVVVYLRFILSWVLRVSGVVGGIGVILLKNFARHLLLGLAWFNVCLIYWKHPIRVFQNNISPDLDRFYAQDFSQKVPGLDISSFYWVMKIFYSLWDLIPAFLIIYFFTRPEIKEQFQQTESNQR